MAYDAIGTQAYVSVLHCRDFFVKIESYLLECVLSFLDLQKK